MKRRFKMSPVQLLFTLAGGLVFLGTVTPARADVAYSASGLIGQYYDDYWGGDSSFFTSTTPSFTRIDNSVNFSDDQYNQDYSPALTPWGFAGTALSDEETFSVRWNGSLIVDSGDTYDFRTLSDDGIEVFINNVLVISNPTLHPSASNTGSIALAAGIYPIKIYYGDNQIHSVAQLEWKSASASDYKVINAVPGPLPLLGASAAFGFSRKLRARLKTRPGGGDPLICNPLI